VVDRREQFGVETGQASEDLCVGAISLAWVVIDRSQLAGIGDENIMTELSEQVTCPARVGADFHGDSTTL